MATIITFKEGEPRKVILNAYEKEVRYDNWDGYRDPRMETDDGKIVLASDIIADRGRAGEELVSEVQVIELHSPTVVYKLTHGNPELSGSTIGASKIQEIVFERR